MSDNGKITGIYVRVSSAQQSMRSQNPDLKRWVNANFEPENQDKVKWFRDSATGKNMDRPGWQKLQAAIDQNEIDQIVTWRLDRLGRTAAGLCQLFDDLQKRKINLISLKESIDLKSPSGRLLANILASVAAFETELRGERVKAGQEAARAAGKRWGGSEKGRLAGISIEQAKMIVKLHQEGMKKTSISKAVNVHRSSIYRILQNYESGLLKL